MPRSQQVKNSFQSGVLSPRLSLRFDTDKYRHALERCINWIVNPQGGIVMREGFQNQFPVPVIDKTCRMFQFHNGGNTSDMLLIITADNLIRFYIDGVLQDDTVAHTFTQAELEELEFTNQEAKAVILHPDHPPLYIEINLDGDIVGEEMLNSSIALMDYQDAHSPLSFEQASANYDIEFVDVPGETGGTWEDRNFHIHYGPEQTGIDLFLSQSTSIEKEYTSNSAKLINRIGNALKQIGSLNTGGTQYYVIVADGEVANSTNKYTIVITGPGAGQEMRIFPKNTRAERYCTVVNSLEEVILQEKAWSYPTYVLHSGTYYQCVKPHLSEAGINEPVNSTYWLDVGTTKPVSFDWQYPDGNDWTDTTPTGDVVGIAYAPGNRGFPTVGVIHQQRMILMATPALSMGIFGSRINFYKDFLLGPQDNDPFYFAIDSSDTPAIRWAQSQIKLILGTSSGDFNVSAQVTLSPSDISAFKQNNARSNSSSAVTINTDVFYIEQGKEKVRSTGYVDDLNSRSSSDISLLAEHLLNARAKRIVLMQTPEVVTYILREDGSLVCISYSHELGVGAWYEFESAGYITDIAIQYTITTDEDELWATVTYDNGLTHYIEKMPYPKRVFTVAKALGDPFFVDQDLVMLDGWIKGTLVQGDNNVIQGLEQFEGLTVGCIVEDAWTGEYQVQDGAIILDAADIEDNYAGTWAVGHRYTATAKTFEMSNGNPQGTAIFTKRSWNQLFVKTLDSAMPVINGILPPDRRPSALMGMADIIQDGLVDVEISDIDWGDGSITIVQDKPYPTNLIGVGGQYTSNSG